MALQHNPQPNVYNLRPRIDTTFPLPITLDDAKHFEEQVRIQKEHVDDIQDIPLPNDHLPPFPDNDEDTARALRIVEYWVQYGIRRPERRVNANGTIVTEQVDDLDISRAFAILMQINPNLARQITIRYLTVHAILDQRLDTTDTDVTVESVRNYIPRDWHAPENAFTVRQNHLPWMWLQMLDPLDTAWWSSDFRPFRTLVPTAGEDGYLPFSVPRDLAHHTFNQAVFTPREQPRSRIRRFGRTVAAPFRRRAG
ncbi:hypothetical protein QBC36DRAFT_315248 [Triangularia setosa]|uniref:Uncharacterized protein n=1 Tax=Triangularia setosa TaxID=2587417 RepID=A0AAN6VYH3_9PEZI|nr:hypothetical protein QBC36DRAFT_315248 [Podospora setosa]